MSQIQLNQLTLTRLDFSGLQTLAGWACDEGWNPGPHDAEVFWATDPDGYYGYFWNGELIAGGSIVSYNGDFGFMGFFIVKPAFRSFGIGRKLWFERRDLLLKKLRKGAAIGMDGVVAMQPFYKKGGFELAFRDERHLKFGEEFSVHPHISLIEEHDMESIVAYDKQCFGFYRPQFLKPWMKIPGNKLFKFVSEGKLNGFTIMCRAVDGYKICPLFADNEYVAEALYQACLNVARGEKVFLDIPVNNPAAARLINKYNTTYVFECARMYYGIPPEVAQNKIFGITTFELG